MRWKHRLHDLENFIAPFKSGPPNAAAGESCVLLLQALIKDKASDRARRWLSSKFPKVDQRLLENLAAELTGPHLLLHVYV